MSFFFYRCNRGRAVVDDDADAFVFLSLLPLKIDSSYFLCSLACFLRALRFSASERRAISLSWKRRRRGNDGGVLVIVEIRFPLSVPLFFLHGEWRLAERGRSGEARKRASAGW